MRKVLICVLSAVIILTVGGCSSKPPEATKQEGNVVSEKEGSIAPEQVNSEMIKYFGKVKSVVGNEIELELAKEMVVEVADETELQDGVGIVSVGDVTAGGEPGGEISSSVSASEATDTDIKEFASVGGQAMTQTTMSIGNGEKVELEYTGETKNIIIPAGASIFNFVTGKEGKVTDIKEGSVVMIYADGTDKSPVVSNVEIRE